jgi:hypothetical protein
MSARIGAGTVLPGEGGRGGAAMEAGTVTLGALAPESDRALVVVAPDGELAVGLRESLGRAWVVVKDARPDEAWTAVASCRPWPWMVVGAVPELPPQVAAVLDHHPVLVLWLGPAPSRLPAHSRGFSRFSMLAAAAALALDEEVAGMRLAVGAGVQLPGGRISRSAELQALVSAHPAGFALPVDTFHSAARTLARHRIPLRPHRDPATGLVSLR